MARFCPPFRVPPGAQPPTRERLCRLDFRVVSIDRAPRALRLSRAIALAQAPIILRQGRHLRRSTPRLPDAPLPWEGSLGDGEAPLNVLVLGDSTAAGVGVDHAELGLAGRLAEALEARTGRPVHWRARGRNGATARDLVRDYLDEALDGEVDVLFLTVGANDALALRSARAFRRDVRRIIHRTRKAHPQSIVLMSSLPAFFRFRLLPEPLRSALYRHSQALEAAARAVVAEERRAHMSPPPPPYTDGFFASDDFHPSSLGYRDWADFAVDDAVAAGVLRELEIGRA
jgi:lysophospholipase L1-like esterase